MTHRAVALIVLMFSGPSVAGAQDASGLRIVVHVSVGRQDGGDRRSTGGLIDPAAIGTTVAHAFSRLAGQCGTGVGPAPLRDAGVAHDGSMKRVVSGWTVQTTPIRLAGEAATFRLQWTRNRDNGRPSSVGDDMQLTLRPGQDLAIDLMPQSDEASTACLSLSLGVGVVHWPEPGNDRRLLAIELWLVERLPDGTERSQLLSLRGRYNEPIPFYFDTLGAATKTLDIFGDLQILPEREKMGVKFTTRSRVLDKEPTPRPPGYPAGEPWPRPYAASTMATLTVAPGEVVSVGLPPAGSRAEVEAFAARALSFRIRVRQIR